jgi:hypothetical protein
LLCQAKPITLKYGSGLRVSCPVNGVKCYPPNEGAFVNFLTLASSESEYRYKLTGALTHYRLELQGLEDVRPLSESDGASEEIMLIASELEAARNPKHVSYSTFHIFPRVM